MEVIFHPRAQFGPFGQMVDTGHSLVVVTDPTPGDAEQSAQSSARSVPPSEQAAELAETSLFNPVPGPAPRPEQSRSQTVRGSIAVGLVLLLAGVLFVTNIRSQEGDGARGPSNLAELIIAESERVAQRQESVEDLRAVVDELTQNQPDLGPPIDREAADRLALAAGAVDMAGPGIAVEMSDASPDALRINQDLRPDDLVVHQQDLQSVVNAIWAGGAEAMTIQGQRVSSNSAVRCVGNTLMLHGQLYSPPYRIEAIGPQEEMLDSLHSDAGVQLYLQYVEVVGLGWSEETLDEVEVPAYDSSIKQASVPDDVDVLGTLDAQVPLEPENRQAVDTSGHEN